MKKISKEDQELMAELKTQFFDGLRQLDIHPSNEMCCQILAWLLVYGGSCEDTIYNERFNVDIMAAQKRLNLYGSEIPNLELLPILQDYIAHLEDYYNPPDWVLALENKYRIDSHRQKLSGGSE